MSSWLKNFFTYDPNQGWQKKVVEDIKKEEQDMNINKALESAEQTVKDIKNIRGDTKTSVNISSEQLKRLEELDLIEKAKKLEIPDQKILLSKFKEIHQTDIDSYEIEFKRWYDFISIAVKRGEQNFMGAIPLIATNKIELVLGSIPNNSNEIRFYERYHEEYKTKNIDYRKTSADFKTIKVSDTVNYFYSWNISKNKVLVSELKNFSNPVKSAGYYERYYNNTHINQIDYKVPNAAKDAIDDVIIFHGPDQVLYTPAGLGKFVYDELMKEIGKGKK